MTSKVIPKDFQRLTDFICELSFSDLNESQAGKAKDHIADTLACGVGGMCSAEGRLALAAMVSCGEYGKIPIWGTPIGLSARAAAFCNGVATHSFELDDTDGCDHSGAVVIPAAMSALSIAKVPVSGAQLIAAVAAGYEVARRVQTALGGYWPHNGAGWHSTATCGTFGAAVAVGKILHLSPHKMRSAIGHAASYSGGIWSFIHDGSQTKRVHAGKAAEGGLTAALLADAGLTGPVHIFTASWGSFAQTFGQNGFDAQTLVARLGVDWEFDKAAIKPYASCRSTHAAVDAVLSMVKKRGLSWKDIREVQIVGSRGLTDMCGGVDLSTMASAQMSISYAVTSAIEFGDVPLSAYSSSARCNAELTGRMSRVKIIVDEALSQSSEPTVSLLLNSGEALMEHVDPPLGAPQNPMTSAALRRKNCDLMAMAMPLDRVTEALDVFARLDELDDVRSVPHLLRSEGMPSAFD